MSIHLEQKQIEIVYTIHTKMVMQYYIRSSRERLYVRYMYIQWHTFYNSWFFFHSELVRCNCTDKCQHPTFRFLYLQSCDCPVCHHIVGCVSTTINILGNVEVICRVVFRYGTHNALLHMYENNADDLFVFTLVMIQIYILIKCTRSLLITIL